MTRLPSTRTWRRIDATLFVVWLVVVPVAFAAGWLKSVVFVSAVSIYANAVAHLAAWRADA